MTPELMVAGFAFAWAYPTVSGFVYRQLCAADPDLPPVPPAPDDSHNIGWYSGWPPSRCPGWRDILDENRVPRGSAWRNHYCLECWARAEGIQLRLDLQKRARDRDFNLRALAWAWPVAWLPWTFWRLYRAGEGLGSSMHKPHNGEKAAVT